MNIQNLIVGQSYKYKELCEVLGIEPTSKANNSRIAQFKELERYCKYHKQGHSIIIDIMNVEVGEKVDNRKLGNNNEQAKNIRYLLCNLLSNYKLDDGEVIGFSKGLLLRKLGMINENYINAKCASEKYALALGVSTIAVDECIEYVDNRSINALKKAIQVLIRQKVIGYKYSYSWVDIKGVHHHTNVFEHNAIMEAEYEVMEKMNVRDKGLIFEYGRWEEFKSKVKNHLQEEYKGLFSKLNYYYSSFHFHYNMEQLQKHMRYMEQRQGVSYGVARNEVSKLFSNSLDTTIENQHTKAKENTPFGDNIDAKVNYRKSENYIMEQKRVKDSIVNPEHREVKLNEQMKFDIDNVDIPF